MASYQLIGVWGIPIKINISLIVFLPILAWLIGAGQEIQLYAAIIDGFTATPLDTAALQTGIIP